MDPKIGSDLSDFQAENVTILVVDDSILSAQLVQTHLERGGYQVMLAHSGAAALEAVQDRLPDLVILDVMMPGLDGFVVCELLKADPKTRFVPVILLTALNQPRDRIRGIEAGADDFLSKPFNKEELAARVRSLLRLKFARDALQIERNHLALLYSISQEINRQLALDEVLNKIVTGTRQALKASMCSIITFNEEQQIARQFISREGVATEVAGSVSPAVFQEGLGGWVLRHRVGTIVDDASQDDRWLVLPGDTEPVGSVVAAPLLLGQQILGVLLATHTEPRYYDENQMILLTSIAAQAAVAVRNAHLYEAEQQRRQELERLQVAGAEITAELSREKLINLIAHQATIVLEVDAASLMLIDEPRGYLTIAAWQGLSERYVHRERIAYSQVAPLLSEGKRSFQLTVPSQHSIGRSDLLAREGVTGQLSLALVASRQFMGLLNLYSLSELHGFQPEMVSLAETYAQQAAVALANAQLLERTREERGKLSAVLSSTTDAVLVVDEAGILIMANPSAERTLGPESPLIVGQRLAGSVPPPLVEIFDQVSAGGQPVSAEIPAGRGRTLYVSVSPVTGVGQVAVVQDITPLKELEVMRLRSEQEQRRLIRQVFERYVGPELVDRILAQEAGLLERRERRDVVVLFADLRRFSDMTAAFPAHAVIEVLNEFYTAMVDIVHWHQGTIFDLAGDELMVGFGAPLAQEDAAERALHAAGDMQRAFAQRSHRWRDEEGIEIGLGIGLDRGFVVMGSIGAPSHMNFGMVGDAVNTAHRIVEVASEGQILVSGAVVDSLGGELEGWSFEPQPAVEISHRAIPLQVYRARLQKDNFS